MSNEWKVAILEQAKRLVELGVVLESERVWFESEGGTKILDQQPFDKETALCWSIYPAPDVAELGRVLPKIIKANNTGYYHSGSRLNHGGFFSMAYETDDDYLGTWMEKTEAQTRADAVIWLVENKRAVWDQEKQMLIAI